VVDAELFVDDDDRRAFLWLLNTSCSKFTVLRRAYCLMSTHYHLLLEGTSADLSRVMRRVNSRYAQRFNERHGRFGHLFAERYTVRVIHDDAHLAQVYAYIDANPAEAGLCEFGERWPWSWSDAVAAA
jgi:REP element-mobilizing transposase RayT